METCPKSVLVSLISFVGPHYIINLCPLSSHCVVNIFLLFQIDELKMKVVELAGVKKPALKKVRMSADAMLQALLGGKHKVTMDLRSNLKQVKKEVKEEVKRHSNMCLKTHCVTAGLSPAAPDELHSSFRVLRLWATGVRTLRTKLTGRRCLRPLKDFHIQLSVFTSLWAATPAPTFFPFYGIGKPCVIKSVVFLNKAKL